MSRSMKSGLAAAIACSVFGLLLLRTEVHSVQVQAATAAALSGWDYQTASVDLASLTPKLMELSKDGWEVINIISIDTMIDQTPDGKAHILTQRVEVTSRRPKVN